MRAVLIPYGEAFAIALILGDQTAFLPFDPKNPWQTGKQTQAIVRSLRAGADGGGGFCQDQPGQSYYLRKARDLFEGQHLTVQVMAEAQPGKLPTVEVMTGDPHPPALIDCLSQFGSVSEIEVADLDQIPELRSQFPRDPFVFQIQDLVEMTGRLEELNNEPSHIISPDLSLRFEHTQTAKTIDVDGSGPIAQINAAAAPQIADGIIARNWGGIILIDFLPPGSKEDRRMITQLVADRLSPWPHKIKIHAMNESGHLIVERQRLGPGLELKTRA